MIKLIALLWIKHLRHLWSNWRHRGSIKETPESNKSWFPKTMRDLAVWLGWLESRFTYTADSWTMLWDSMDTPAACLDVAINSPPLRDDCDGFHAAVMEGLNNIEGCEVQLLTYVTQPIKYSHTVAVAKLQDSCLLIDYDKIETFNGLEELVSHVARFNNAITHEFSQYSPDKGWHTGWTIN